MVVSARQLAALLLTAFLVGALFRLYNETGVGFYRMFGTLGIVVMGWIGVRIVTSWQLKDATAGMQDVLDALPEGWRALERGAPIGVLGWQGYIVGPKGTLAVTTLPTPNYAKGRSLRRSLRQGFVRAEALAETAPRDEVVFPIVPCVVLLRRRADEEARAAAPQGGLVLDVDGLKGWVTGATDAAGRSGPPEVGATRPN